MAEKILLSFMLFSYLLLLCDAPCVLLSSVVYVVHYRGPLSESHGLLVRFLVFSSVILEIAQNWLVIQISVDRHVPQTRGDVEACVGIAAAVWSRPVTGLGQSNNKKAVHTDGFMVGDIGIEPMTPSV